VSAAAALAVAREQVVHVVQGEFAVADRPGTVFNTILGSCVATCLHDPVARIGGMNHFLVPGDAGTTSDSVKYGVNAMELLINALLQRGALRNRLEAKLFGGASVVQNLSDIGAKNGEFAAKFLKAEGINCVGASLGGNQARRVRYWPDSGRAALLKLEAAESVFANERAKPAPTPKVDSGTLDLF
jgi:chemotaxis protein CheD